MSGSSYGKKLIPELKLDNKHVTQLKENDKVIIEVSHPLSPFKYYKVKGLPDDFFRAYYHGCIKNKENKTIFNYRFERMNVYMPRFWGDFQRRIDDKCQKTEVVNARILVNQYGDIFYLTKPKNPQEKQMLDEIVAEAYKEAYEQITGKK